MSNLGLFAKCSLFSMLPIEELALGLRPNSRLHQILHFLHVQLFAFANSNRSKNHQLNWAWAQFFQTACVLKTFKRGLLLHLHTSTRQQNKSSTWVRTFMCRLQSALMGFLYHTSRCSWINDIGLKPNLHQRIKHSPLPFNSPMCIQSEDRCG